MLSPRLKHKREERREREREGGIFIYDERESLLEKGERRGKAAKNVTGSQRERQKEETMCVVSAQEKEKKKPIKKPSFLCTSSSRERGERRGSGTITITTYDGMLLLSSSLFFSLWCQTISHPARPNERRRDRVAA